MKSPRKLEVFSMELRYILGSDSDRILGVAPILERTILEAFCIQLKIAFEQISAASFADRVGQIREVYNNRNKITPHIADGTGSLEHDVLSARFLGQENRGEG